MKILKDSINLLVSRTLPPGGGSAQELTSELEGVLANYHKLCDRFKSKCHTLEVVCVCGCIGFEMLLKIMATCAFMCLKIHKHVS